MQTKLDISQPYELIRNFYLTKKSEPATLRIQFQNQQVDLSNQDSPDHYTFFNEETIANGKPLGSGGMKKVYYINGKAVFIILSNKADILLNALHEEASLSHQMLSVGICAQKLKRGTVQIFDSKANNYLDYPCMYADSFSELSANQAMEIYDIKNGYRFGRKNQLYDSDEDMMSLEKNRLIFQDILDDVALLLFSGFSYDATDSINLAITPSKRSDLKSTVRLFLYDFTSKDSQTKITPKPRTELPGESRIKCILERLVRYTIETDYMVRNNESIIYGGIPIELNNNFFENCYPTLEKEFTAAVLNKMDTMIKKQEQLTQHLKPFAQQSTELKEALQRFSLYHFPEERPRATLVRSNSCLQFS